MATSGRSARVRLRRALALSTVLLRPRRRRAPRYFGQNRVQYKNLDFQVLKTEHFDIYFYPEERAGIDIAARLAERWYARLTRMLNHTLSGRQPLVLYASHTDFEQNNIVPKRPAKALAASPNRFGGASSCRSAVR